MSRDEDLILNLLLDRYERSQHYREGAAPADTGKASRCHRAVFLKYDRKTLPDYWDERRWERRLELNQATEQLEREGLITVRRSRYSREEIERVDLVLERLGDAYRRAGRVPKRTQEERLAAVAGSWAPRWPAGDWRRQFASAVSEAVASYQRPPARLSPGDENLLADICRVLDALGPTGLEAEMPRRIFSQRVLGDSKRLETIQGGLMRVLREFWPGELPDEDREALAELGVVENPQHLLVAGPVVLDTLDVGALGCDVGLSAPFVKRCRVTSLEADQVITVENLTSFFEVVAGLPPRTVAVYLGGYHNHLRRQFLLKLATARPLRFYHWGDIDLGGFRIFVHLQKRTGLPLEPLLMNRETYCQYADRGMPFDERYAQELRRLLKETAYQRFWTVIEAMLTTRRRVEQESIRFRWT